MKISRKNLVLRHQSIKELKYKELFKVTEKFHSSMDTEIVLQEIIQTLQKVFPKYDYCLLMSNDYEVSAQLPIKALEYNSENHAAMQAYVRGSVEIETGKHPVMYFPLKGKQGVYGVLQVKTHLSTSLLNSEIDFIGLLANTAGSALENAKLYAQSRKLIEELQLINKTNQKLTSLRSLIDTIDFLSEQITKSFPASEVGFILLENNEFEVLQGSSRYFYDQASLQLVNTLLAKLNREKESLFIGDIKQSLEEVDVGYGALVAVPMIHGDTLKGIAIALGDESYSFSFEMFKLFQSLIERATLALINLMLREKLEQMVITDQLTGLYARHYLNHVIETSIKKDREGVFIMIDLDDFKKVNDTYGHDIGDSVLVQVAEQMKEELRGENIGARWGGEEFSAYLPNASIESGLAAAERLRDQVMRNTNPAVTITCGVSHWHFSQSVELKSLFNRADAALYEAKNAGKNRVDFQA